jgi:L-lysine 2,3-aminomutase
MAKTPYYFYTIKIVAPPGLAQIKIPKIKIKRIGAKLCEIISGVAETLLSGTRRGPGKKQKKPAPPCMHACWPALVRQVCPHNGIG